MELNIEGIPVAVRRKNIKRLHLYVKPPDGRVEVSAPNRLSGRAIEGFVRTHLTWILQQRRHIADQPPPPERRFVTGEPLLLWGERYTLQVEHGGRKNSLVAEGGWAVLTVRAESTPRQREAFVREWYRARLKQAIEERLPRWEARTGLYCASWQTKDMTTRWGTCNPAAKKLWFNVQLAKKPPECLDYVLLHELAHLKVSNHGRDFTAILDAHMPHWREVRRELNRRDEADWPPAN